MVHWDYATPLASLKSIRRNWTIFPVLLKVIWLFRNGQLELVVRILESDCYQLCSSRCFPLDCLFVLVNMGLEVTRFLLDLWVTRVCPRREMLYFLFDGAFVNESIRARFDRGSFAIEKKVSEEWSGRQKLQQKCLTNSSQEISQLCHVVRRSHDTKEHRHTDSAWRPLWPDCKEHLDVR